MKEQWYCYICLALLRVIISDNAIECTTRLERSGTATRGDLAGDARAGTTLLWVDEPG